MMSRRLSKFLIRTEMGEEILLRSTSLTVVNPIPFVFDVCCKDAVES